MIFLLLLFSADEFCKKFIIEFAICGNIFLFLFLVYSQIFLMLWCHESYIQNIESLHTVCHS